MLLWSSIVLRLRASSRRLREGWFSKTQYQGGITPANARAFVFVTLGKASAELQRREDHAA
jgi:hypothetical protein